MAARNPPNLYPQPPKRTASLTSNPDKPNKKKLTTVEKATAKKPTTTEKPKPGTPVSSHVPAKTYQQDFNSIMHILNRGGKLVADENPTPSPSPELLKVFDLEEGKVLFQAPAGGKTGVEDRSDGEVGLGFFAERQGFEDGREEERERERERERIEDQTGERSGPAKSNEEVLKRVRCVMRQMYGIDLEEWAEENRKREMEERGGVEMDLD